MAKRRKRKASTKSAKVPVYGFTFTPQVKTAGVSLNAMPDAQAAGETIRKIQDASPDGICQFREIWQSATSPRHPLHSTFEWDDSVAGAKYRDEQARYLVRCIKVNVKIAKDVTKFIRSSVAVQADDGSRGVMEVTRAMKDATTREYVLQQALAGLVAWRKRWKELNDLAECQASIESVDHAIGEMQTVVAAG